MTELCPYCEDGILMRCSEEESIGEVDNGIDLITNCRYVWHYYVCKQCRYMEEREDSVTDKEA